MRKLIARFMGTKKWLRPGVRSRIVKFLNPHKEGTSEPFEVSLRGLRFSGDLSVSLDRAVFFFGAYEPQELDTIESVVKRDHVCLDIGCNTGQHALIMAKHANTVHAFEPLERVRKTAERRMLENGFGHVTIHPFGIGKTSRHEQFYFDENSTNNATGSFVVDHDPYSKSVGELEIRNGDDVVSELSLTRVDFVKIDVEGFEAEVLGGLEQTMKTYRPLVMLEISETAFRGFGSASLSDLFPGKYSFFKIVRGKPVAIVFFDPRPMLSKIDDLKPEAATFNVLAVPTEQAGKVTRLI